MVIGAAFGAVVSAVVRDLITPLIAAIAGKPDFSGLSFTIHHSRFQYGDFLNTLLSFVIIATVVFFLVVRPINALIARARTQPTPDESTRKCPECLSEVPVAARRCAYCTSTLEPA